MNTEKLKTLEQVHNALTSIEHIRGGNSATIEQQVLLEKIAFRLWNMEQALIRKIGADLTDTLVKETKSLSRLIKKLKLNASSLKTLIKNLEKAVTLTKALTKILKIAIKAGLV